MATLTFQEVTTASWPDFEALFDAKGCPHFCYCMVWRAIGAERKLKGAARKASVKLRVDGGTPIGLLGYLDGAPVAWCSIAPRPTYRRLGGLEVEGERPEDVWSLACFFIKREHRGRGLTTELIAAAITQAKNHGARVLEAYPVDHDAPSYRFMGFTKTFEAAGFVEVARAGYRRHVMRLGIAEISVAGQSELLPWAKN